MIKKKLPGRIVVHSKDVENITGLMPRSARRLLQLTRMALGKPKGALITKKEFCSYTGFEEELVEEFLKY